MRGSTILSAELKRSVERVRLREGKRLKFIDVVQLGGYYVTKTKSWERDVWKQLWY